MLVFNSNTLYSFHHKYIQCYLGQILDKNLIDFNVKNVVIQYIIIHSCTKKCLLVRFFCIKRVFSLSWINFFENTVVFWFFCWDFISSSCPCIFHVKFYRFSGPYWLLSSMFLKTCFAVNWFAFCWFKWDSSCFLAITTLNFKHLFLGHIITSELQ